MHVPRVLRTLARLSASLVRECPRAHDRSRTSILILFSPAYPTDLPRTASGKSANSSASPQRHSTPKTELSDWPTAKSSSEINPPTPPDAEGAGDSAWSTGNLAPPVQASPTGWRRASLLLENHGASLWSKLRQATLSDDSPRQETAERSPRTPDETGSKEGEGGSVGVSLWSKLRIASLATDPGPDAREDSDFSRSMSPSSTSRISRVCRMIGVVGNVAGIIKRKKSQRLRSLKEGTWWNLILNGDLDAFQQVVKHDSAVLNNRDPLGATPLHLLLLHNTSASLRMLEEFIIKDPELCKVQYEGDQYQGEVCLPWLLLLLLLPTL